MGRTPYLCTRHAAHGQTLDETEHEDPPLRALYRTDLLSPFINSDSSHGRREEWWTYVPVLPRTEVLLRPLNTAQTATQLVNTLLQTTRLFRQRDRFSRRDRSRLTLDHDVEIDELLGEGRHVVGEAERVFPDMVRREDVVSLALPFALEYDRVCRIRDGPVYVERASRLDLDTLVPSARVA
jgi:hypothetical protein